MNPLPKSWIRPCFAYEKSKKQERHSLEVAPTTSRLVLLYLFTVSSLDPSFLRLPDLAFPSFTLFTFSQKTYDLGDLRMEVGLGPGDVVLDGDPAPPP